MSSIVGQTADWPTGLQKSSLELPPFIQPSWQPLQDLTSTCESMCFDPLYTIMPLLPNIFRKESQVTGSNLSTTTRLDFSLTDDTTSVAFNDFDHYLALGEQSKPLHRERTIEDEFGFDPVTHPSMSNALEIQDIEMTTTEHEYEKRVGYATTAKPPNVQHPPEHPAKLPDSYSWECLDSPTISSASSSFHNGIVSPRLQPASKTPYGAPSATAPVLSPTLPLAATTSPPQAPRKGRPPIYRIDGTKFPPRRPPSNSSNSNGSGSGSGSDHDAKDHRHHHQQRRISLEKNRQAAAKSREKKRGQISHLKAVSDASAAENRVLKRQTMQMRDEILGLQARLLAHVAKGGCSEGGM